MEVAMKLFRLGLLLTVSLAFMLAGCGGGGGGTTTGTTTPSTTPATSTLPEGSSVVLGSDVSVETRTIDSTGGIISIVGTGTVLDGVAIDFPSGALGDSSSVNVSYNTGSITMGTTSGSNTRASVSAPILSMTIDGEGANFDQLVEITVPYTDINDLPVPFYIDSNNNLKPVLITNIDEANKTVTFVTGHASRWTWLVDLFTDTPDEDTEFRPSDDGFQIANYGSTINSGGECFGMTTFAQWYYDKHTEDGDYYDRFMTSVGLDSAGDSITGQDVIATRAFSAANQSWNWYEYILPNINTSDEYRYKAIVAAMEVTKRPVNLSIKKVDANGNFVGGHAVLAYGVDSADGEIFIYDPNYPGTTKYITYNTTTKTFDTYGVYTKFFLNGTGTYDLEESYDNILDDAEHSFTTDNMPAISISSHESGDTVTERTITLVGNVESSEVLITKLEVVVGAEKYTAEVADDGSFDVSISLTIGENILNFTTLGELNGELYEITPNNFDTDPFVINLDMDTSVMLVTLTWDKNDTDLDLYVIDPNGDYSAYYHKTTADGGELDHDITTGYGPEHWTLTTADTVRWDTDSYTVRVHYYSDHSNGGTNYTLTVQLYEDTDYEVEYVKTGYISTNSSSNNQPADTGDDWVDFTFPITLNSDYSVSSTVARSSAMPIITAIIPALEERMKAE